MIDLKMLFETFTDKKVKVDYRNKEDLMFFFKWNVAQVVYAENGKSKMVVVTSNKNLIDEFKKKSTVTKAFNSIVKKVTRKLTSNNNSLEIKCFDFLKEKPWSIPLNKDWKVIRYVPITIDNVEELISRMYGVFEANKNTKNRKTEKNNRK